MMLQPHGREPARSVATAAAARSPEFEAPHSETFTRVERKLLVDPKRLGLIRAWLAHACAPAPAYPVGQVSSCYYDTPDMDEYFASADGDLYKHKVRLRWYGSVAGDGNAIAFVELKSKQGAETAKRRAPLTVPALALADEEFGVVLPRETLTRYLLGFGHRPPLDLRPTVVVTYHRYRFVDRQSQMTLSLDSSIRAWLPGAARCSRPVQLGVAVVELKGRTVALPPLLRPLARFAPVWSAFTKYGAAIEALADAPGPFRP